MKFIGDRIKATEKEKKAAMHHLMQHFIDRFRNFNDADDVSTRYEQVSYLFFSPPILA